MARLIAAVRRLQPDDEALQAAELISRLAAFADTVALFRRTQRRPHQAAAARIAGAELRAVAARCASSAVDGTTPRFEPIRSPAARLSMPHPGRHGVTRR